MNERYARSLLPIDHVRFFPNTSTMGYFSPHSQTIHLPQINRGRLTDSLARDQYLAAKPMLETVVTDVFIKKGRFLPTGRGEPTGPAGSQERVREGKSGVTRGSGHRSEHVARFRRGNGRRFHRVPRPANSVIEVHYYSALPSASLSNMPSRSSNI